MIKAPGDFEHVRAMYEGEETSFMRGSFEADDVIQTVWYGATDEGFMEVDEEDWKMLETMYHEHNVCGGCHGTVN